MARALGRVAVLVLFVLFFLAAPAAADHVQCGDVITTDTTLDSDLTCTGDGLSVGASGVTLNLAGHTVQGMGPDGIGVTVSSADHVAVRNGRIRGFLTGVYTDGSRGTTLDEVTLALNGTGLDCQYAPECRIEDSIVRGNNGAGLVVDAADDGSPEPTIVQRNVIRDNGVGMSINGDRAIIADNRFVGNAEGGIRNDYGRPVDIMGNVFSGNGGEGVRITYIANATVSGNRIVGNAGNGVGVYGSGGEFGDTAANVHNNRIERNGGDGVLVEGQGVDVVVARNHTARNADDGIDIDPGRYTPTCCFQVTVQDNKAAFNRDLGIEAAPGTTDGGGNKARHNGNPAQCVGVSCR